MLFFLQLVVDFIETIYAIELLSLSLDENVLFVLFLFSPILLILFRDTANKMILMLSGGGVIIMRIFEPFLTLHLKLIVSGLGVGCFLIFLPVYFRFKQDFEEESTSFSLGLGLVLAVAFSVLFRTLGSGSDLSTLGDFQIIGWIFALIGLVMLLGFLLTMKEVIIQSYEQETHQNTPLFHTKTFLTSLGLISIFNMIYFSISSPTVIARWTESNYGLITVLIAVLLSGFGILILLKTQLLAQLQPWMIWVWNALFIVVMSYSLIVHQLLYPRSLESFPFYAPDVFIVPYITLLFMLLLSPILLIDFILLSRTLLNIKPSLKTLSMAFTSSSIFFLLMLFAHIFTTTYDYIPLIGPLFRDKFWIVYFIIGAVIAITSFLLIKERIYIKEKTISRNPVFFSCLFIIIVLSTVSGIFITSPRPIIPSIPTSLKIATYNIQQGTSEQGIKNLEGQLALLNEIDADIIGLQESDIARISGGNADAVRFFADRLNLFSYYGPKTVAGTFGIALLSKFPIQNLRTFYMYSQGEQTATIEAEVKIGARIFTIYVTHLGNGGPLIQQQNILENLVDQNVILMGDFNFEPYSEQYNLTISVLNDSWFLSFSATVVGNDFDVSERIDHIFVSSGYNILTSQFIVSNDSDHPLYWVSMEI